MSEHEMANELVMLKARFGNDFCMDLAMEDLSHELPSGWGGFRDEFIAKVNHILTGTGLEIKNG
tara:strand:+ start:107 stop:298 length:192 start_codon:yes stop_codon:yes gene_type:complete